MHFYKNGKKMDCYAQDFSVPFDASKVEESENIPGRFYVTGEPNADGVSPWRWLTAEENDNRDIHRHDDDGFGGAVDHAKAHATASLVAEGNTSDISDDNDLGTNWGKSGDPQSVEEAYNLSQANTGRSFQFEGPEGAASLELLPDMAKVAHQMVDDAIADPVNKRFAVLVFHMENADPETTNATGVTRVTRASTAGDAAILDYAEHLAFQILMQNVKAGDDIGAAANKLEI